MRLIFSYLNTITQVEIINAATFGTKGNVGDVYLQTSTDGLNWTTVSAYTMGLSSTSTTIVFGNLNIEEGSYIKIVVELASSGTKWMTFLDKSHWLDP